jgi:uncharacterized protein with PIN domain
MVVDTSALFAILVGEDERDQFEDLILRSPVAVISVVSIVETVIALTRKQLDIGASDIDGVLSALGSPCVPSTSIKVCSLNKLFSNMAVVASRLVLISAIVSHMP